MKYLNGILIEDFEHRTVNVNISPILVSTTVNKDTLLEIRRDRNNTLKEIMLRIWFLISNPFYYIVKGYIRW